MKGKWIGIIDGTNKGQCVLDLQEKEGKTEGSFFLHDIKYQNLNGKLELEIKDNKFTGKVFDFTPNTEGNPKSASLKGEIGESGEEIKGEWSTDVGTKGTLHLFKHKEEVFLSPVPTAFISKPFKLPACKMDARELGGLLALMMKDIAPNVQPTFVINYRGSSFFKMGLEAFIKDTALPRIINDMTISFNEPNTQSGYKVVNLNFKPSEDNNASISGDNPTWVNGRAAEIQDYVSRYKSKSTVFFTKYGPIINSIIFLFVLTILPSINSIIARVVLTTISVLALLILTKIYKNWFPKAIIYLGDRERSFWDKNKDSILAGLIIALVGAVITFIAKYLTLNLNKVSALFGVK
jgi:hypothetical protein